MPKVEVAFGCPALLRCICTCQGVVDNRSLHRQASEPRASDVVWGNEQANKGKASKPTVLPTKQGGEVVIPAKQEVCNALF